MPSPSLIVIGAGICGAFSAYLLADRGCRVTVIDPERINQLIQSCLQDPYIDIGRPEALRENLAGCSSRRIDDRHRLVCRIDGPFLLILALLHQEPTITHQRPGRCPATQPRRRPQNHLYGKLP